MTQVSVTGEGVKTPANDVVRASAAPVTCAGHRSDGERCGSRILVDGTYCNRHSPTASVDNAQLARVGGLASVEVRREQAKTVRDRLREKVEENVEEIWKAFESGLLSDDERVQIAAATAVLAEAYGRPAQSIIGDPERPVAFVLDSLLSRAREAA